MEFVKWLQNELDSREWSQNELARRIGMSSGSMSLLMNELRQPGPDVCKRIARALKMSETVVFVEAGLLDPPRTAAEVTLRELYDLLRDLPVEEQRAILDEARQRWESIHGACTDSAASS